MKNGKMKKLVGAAIAILLLVVGLTIYKEYLKQFPQISVTPLSKEIYPMQAIKVSIQDNEGIERASVCWDNDITVPIASLTTITAPKTLGAHTLEIIAFSNSGKSSRKFVQYEVVPKPDTTPPTIIVNPSSGTVFSGSKIIVIISDPSGISKYECLLDGEAADVKKIDDAVTAVTLEITLPKNIEVGVHKLYIDASDNVAQKHKNSTGQKEFIYTVSGEEGN